MAKKKKLKLVRISGYPPIKGVMSKGYDYKENLIIDYGETIKPKDVKVKINSQAERTRNIRELFSKKY